MKSKQINSYIDNRQFKRLLQQMINQKNIKCIDQGKNGNTNKYKRDNADHLKEKKLNIKRSLEDKD